MSSNTYFIVGSVALLSYTKPHGYDRQIHDIDIIMDTEEARKVSEKLVELGYQQSTFINPRMPFYKMLTKLADNKYLRFSKDGVDIEILSTPLIESSDLISFEMYPNILVKLPIEVFVTSDYAGINFSTVTKEMLYFFKRVASNTMGRKVKYKEKQRYDDTSQIEKLVNKDLFLSLQGKCYMSMFGISFKIPKFFIK